jgi:uncharacterized integral membrane protein
VILFGLAPLQCWMARLPGFHCRPIRARLGARLSRLQEEAAMRWASLTVIVLFAAIIVIFRIQNRELVTMSFLGFSVRAPLAILVAIVYVLGALTGGTLFALLRRSVRESQA